MPLCCNRRYRLTSTKFHNFRCVIYQGDRVLLIDGLPMMCKLMMFYDLFQTRFINENGRFQSPAKPLIFEKFQIDPNHDQLYHHLFLLPAFEFLLPQRTKEYFFQFNFIFYYFVSLIILRVGCQVRNLNIFFLFNF